MFRKQIAAIFLMLLFGYAEIVFSQTAPEDLEQKALAGDVEAQYELGSMYLAGKITADANNTRTYYSGGRATIVPNELSPHQQQQLAKQWFQRAADQGSEKAKEMLDAFDPKIFRDLMERRARQGDAQAKYELARLYLNNKISYSPDGKKLNFAEMYAFAYVLLKSAADSGYSDALLELESRSELLNINPSALNYASAKIDYIEPKISASNVTETLERSMPPITSANGQRLASQNASPNENIIREAFGFMQFGDSGWSDRQIKSGPFINGCRVRWSQNAVLAPISAVVDFGLVKWNSATTQARLDGSVWFSVNGEDGLSVTSTDDSEMELAFFANGIVLGRRSDLAWPLQTTVPRFKNALRDLMNECPGITSRY